VGLYAAVLSAAGNQDCVTCHPAEVKLHERTRMAHAMIPATASVFAENLPSQPLHESSNGYEYHFAQALNGISVTAADGDDKAEGVMEWIMGAGAQGQTPIVTAKNGKLESRISYFPQLRQYGITIGQEGGASSTAQAALGVRQSARDLEACIGCHATAVTRDLEPAIPGVQCERCHPGAGQHARGTGTPMNPGKLKPLEQLRFCGACHRITPPVGYNELENVRFQPLRLSKSACFVAGHVSCTTCHVAHQDAVRNDPAFYNGKCAGCHNKESGNRFHADTDARRSGDCIGCHMPYVQLHPALKFTDHFIRVVRAGDLPPSSIMQRGGAGL